MVRSSTIAVWLVLLCVPASAQTPWVDFWVPIDEAAVNLDRLEAAGIPVITWANAVVEVSAFEGLQTVALKDLEARMTPQDPRWDPWLHEINAWFHPRSDLVPFWVPSEEKSSVTTLLGPARHRSDSPGVPPRTVTAVGLVGFSLFYLILLFLDSWSLRPKAPGLWWKAVPAGLLLLVGFALLSGGESPPLKGTPKASWSQHRWFQESWPFGAQWDDFAPGKAWTFPSYEAHQRRMTEVPVVLAAPDSRWEAEAWSSLDRRHAARIFGSPNP